MIKNFETYIAEGRMGRLIDAARDDEIRKEDVLRIYDIEDMKNYLLDKYETKNGRDFYVYLNRDINNAFGGVVVCDLTNNLGIMLYKGAEDFTFTKIRIPTKIIPVFIHITSEYIKNYMFRTIRIDENIYNIEYDPCNGKRFNLKRKDKKQITPEEFIEIYDKIVTNGNPDKLNVRHKQTN